MIRLGLIGAGRWGRNYIRTIQALPEVTLATVASRTLVDANLVITKDWCELLAPGRLDGLIIATPPNTHAAMVEAAFRSGLPCMVEKPLTTDLAEALALQSIAGNVLVLVDHTQLFHPAYLTLKQMAAKLGPIRSIESQAGNYGPFRADYNALWDYAPHDLALCLDLLGARPVRAQLRSAEVVKQPEGTGGSYDLVMDFANGVNTSIKVSNLRRDKMRRFAVKFASETLVFDDVSPQKLANSAGEFLPVPSAMPLTRAVEAFVAGIRGGPRDMFGLALAVDIVRILHEVQH